MPPILERDLVKVSSSLIDGEIAGFLTADQAAQRYMETLNLDDIPTRMRELKKYRVEQEAKKAKELEQQMEMMDKANQAIPARPGSTVKDQLPRPNPDKKYTTAQAK